MNVDALPSALQQRKVREVLEAERLLRQLVSDKEAEAGEERPATTSKATAEGLSAEPVGGRQDLSSILGSQEEEDTPALFQYLEAGAHSLWNMIGADEESRRTAKRQTVTWTVVLSRTNKEKWGFSWDKYRFFAKEQRVVESVLPGSIAAKWNAENQWPVALQERCILAGDRLTCANGRTGAREIATALEGDEVVLEFERVVGLAPEGARRDPVQNNIGIVQKSHVAGSGVETGALTAASRDTNTVKELCKPDVLAEIDAEIEVLEEVSAAPLVARTLNLAPRPASFKEAPRKQVDEPTPSPPAENVCTVTADHAIYAHESRGYAMHQQQRCPAEQSQTQSPLPPHESPQPPTANCQQPAPAMRPVSISVPRRSFARGMGPGAWRSHSSEADMQNVVEVSTLQNSGDDGFLDDFDEDIDEHSPVSPSGPLQVSNISEICTESPPPSAQSVSAEPSSSTETPEFVLALQLAERTETLKFHLDADIEEIVGAFVARINLNPMFQESLLRHVHLMVQTDKRADQVDVVDLI